MKRVGELAQRYPNVNIVLDHIGFPKPAEIPATFGLYAGSPRAHRNARTCYYKYTTLLIEQLHEAKVDPTKFMHHMVSVYGADHMVWGTDIGNSEVDLVEYTKHALHSTEGLSLAQRKAIFYDTAKKVFVPGGVDEVDCTDLRDARTAARAAGPRRCRARWTARAMSIAWRACARSRHLQASFSQYAQYGLGKRSVRCSPATAASSSTAW